MANFSEKVSFIWFVADLIRGPYKPNQYRDVMLPLCVLRRLDCVLEPTKNKVLERYKSLKGGKIRNFESILNKVAGRQFHNISRFTFEKLKGDPNNIAANLTNYTRVFPPRPATSSTISNSRSILRTWTGTTGCSSLFRSSARSTCTRTRSRTWKWDTSLRS